MSLSQYPLDEKEVDEATNAINEEKNEVLTSAISEVSRDFISGNFTPSKNPAISGESDSMSDGDHQGEPHQSGAVYARYPESATGMSDCEWNPYATESDNNFTPWSSASEESPSSPGITSTAGIRFHGDGTRVSSVDVTTDGNRNNSANGNGKKASQKSPDLMSDSVVKSIFDEEYRLALQQPVSSYVLYSPDTRSSSTLDTDVTSRIDGRSNTGSDARHSSSGAGDSVKSHGSETYKSSTENQFVPSSHRDPAQPMASYLTRQAGDRRVNPTIQQIISEDHGGLVKSGSDSDETDPRRRPDPIGQISTRPGVLNPILTGVPHERSSKSPEFQLKAATSRDPVRVSASSRSDFKSPTDTSYVPVDDRNKLLGYSLSLDPPRSKSMKGEDRGATTGGETADPLSQRVAKLLTDANELGSTLHQSLYSKEALGMTDKEDFPKYKFSPVKSGITTPSPTFSGSGPSGPGEVQRLKQQTGDDLTGSLRSSLGEEVAKLMSRTEFVSAKLKEQKPDSTSNSTIFRPIPTENKPSELPTGDSLHKYGTLESSEKGKHSRHGSEESRESVDSLDKRVKEILQKTSYVEKSSPSPPQREPRSEGLGSMPTALDYSLLNRDLQEIQNSLDHHMRPAEKLEADKTSDTNALLESFKFGSETSDVESMKSGGRKLLWDHAGDLGIDESATGHFVGGMKSDAETEFSMKTGVTDFSPGTVRDSYGSNLSGKLGQKMDDDVTVGKEEKNDSAVSDVVSEQMEGYQGNVAADVEEIIARYQGRAQTEQPPKMIEMEPQYQEDTAGLANRVFKILTKEPPEKQATGILEKAMQQEREMLQKMTDRQRLDGSYDLNGADTSFAPRDQDIRRQLEWSAMSSLDMGHPDKTSVSEMSFKKVTDAPFSALGNARTFLSSQLQKTSERTFDHSIELRTPYRRAIECYPVYGMERDSKDDAARDGSEGKKDMREAWPDKKDQDAETRRKERERIISQNPLAR